MLARERGGRIHREDHRGQDRGSPVSMSHVWQVFSRFSTFSRCMMMQLPGDARLRLRTGGRVRVRTGGRVRPRRALLPLFALCRVNADAANDDLYRLSTWWDGKLDCNASSHSCHGAHPTFSHVWYSGSASRAGPKMNSTWLFEFARRHRGLAGKHVIDFGIGGGILGDLLLRSHNVSHYAGVDISNRSLHVALKRLKKLRIAKTPVPRSKWSLHKAPLDFGALTPHADIFISVAVIQHFPSRAHTEAFFANLERSAIATIFLQIKYSGKSAAFVTERDAFELARFEAHAAHATMLNTAYIEAALPSYEVVWQRPKRPRKIEEHVFIELARRKTSDQLLARRHLRDLTTTLIYTRPRTMIR